MRRLAIPLAGAFALLLAAPVHAQERRLDVRVEAVAGENAYLSAGSDDGLAAGDTVQVLRDGAPLGPLRVVSVTRARAAVAFLAEAFPLTRGERLTVVLQTPEPVARMPEAPAPPVEDRTSIFEQPAALPAPSRPASPIRLTGRLQAGSSMLWSGTSPSAGPGVTRQFATPFVGLRATVQGLPLQTRLHVNGRLSYRHRSGNPFDDPTDLRLYQASVESQIGPVQVEAGRLYNSHDRFSGHLDGVRLHVGRRDSGVGVTVGTQPEPAAAGFSADLPKYTAYAHHEAVIQTLRVEVSAVAGQVLPRAAGLTNRTFFGVSQRASSRRVTVSADLLVDQDPADGAWTFSRLHARATWRVLPQLRLHGQALRRRPYLLFGSLQALREASSRFGGGASYTLGGSLLRGTVLRADLSSATAFGSDPSLTYSGGIFVPRLPRWGLGLNATASVWTRDGREAIYASAGVTRSFGRASASLGYRFQQTPLLTESIVTHGIEGTLQLPVLPGVSLTVQGSAQLGETIRTARLYTGLWWRL